MLISRRFCLKGKFGRRMQRRTGRRRGEEPDVELEGAHRLDFRLRGAARFEAAEEPWSLEGAAGIEVDMEWTAGSGVYRPIVWEQ